ncbi:activator of Hsp90 ATPase 1 family protein [Brevibacillus borstelensis AK1]|uniref:Activator of Hsp90 ATPase 1 family protein n=1 Tax=Brevibacillus borstelensis AK1 TaxID=1300222 RepID=M8D237_9BACL|nr:SRPBCC family protein [Brevibacillus borstelensis]EMT50279.1 activator of Hsp90 ATPase 1 family protein [Brevibacillus borstelensis AK1]
MTTPSSKRRTDTASRIIKASPSKIYEALVDPVALISWLPPKGMSGQILKFEARVGGSYQMSLTYLDKDHSTRGKTSEHADVVNGKFLELTPDERIVQAVIFQSDDPQFSGKMIMTWTLAAVPEGTAVTIQCENVPEGIRKEDHDVGLRSSLENLAEYIE